MKVYFHETFTFQTLVGAATIKSLHSHFGGVGMKQSEQGAGGGSVMTLLSCRYFNHLISFILKLVKFVRQDSTIQRNAQEIVSIYYEYLITRIFNVEKEVRVGLS